MAGTVIRGLAVRGSFAMGGSHPMQLKMGEPDSNRSRQVLSNVGTDGDWSP